jgi:energy-converting hydrogenase Eha subunit B
MSAGAAAGFKMDPLEGCYIVALASVFALIPSGPGYAGTQDAAAVTGILALGGTESQAVTYLLLVRFVLAVPITLTGLGLLAGRYGGLRMLRRAR